VATTYTTNNLIPKPADGDTGWGATHRTAMDLIDTILTQHRTAMDLIDTILTQIQQHFRGAVEPATPLANMLWADTGTNTLKLRNAENTAWIVVADMLSGSAGHVAFFARATAPAGYLKANGALISRATYANLFSAIGTTFGVGDGATTFALPDLRGEFIRGFDDARGIDTGRVLGSAQLGTLQVIDPSVAYPSIGVPVHANSVVENIYADAGLDVVAATSYPNMISATALGTANALTSGGWAIGGTRPRNVALLACIKY